ncbi:LysR substrate-binding domain-containing protein [Pseudomonas synxantha]|uniref:LysR substrate-binding domain-containing protein n=1 Tax=Pseudomonas synxantha TaxID=47883 RepID=UPI0009B95097
MPEKEALETAGLRGAAIANLPVAFAADEITDGHLIALLPEWQPAECMITVVFASRRGLMPSVRSLIDLLGEAFKVPCTLGNSLLSSSPLIAP